MKSTDRMEGSPLDPAIRRCLESRFLHDLSRLRVHTNDAAASSAEALGAEAYTSGFNIVFATKRFNPDTHDGIWLLAHEITHVLQQSAGVRTGCDNSPPSRNSLERQADRVADFITSGRILPDDFLFLPATPNSIQCHQGPNCPGTVLSARDRTISIPANEAIEMAYRDDPKTGPRNALFFGSQFESSRDVLPPAGVPNRKFATNLLKDLRGIKNQRRPDIIDFHLRVMYEIKTTGFVDSGTVQKESYYEVADLVRRHHAPNSEPPWRAEYATWYPPHALPFPTDPLRKIVCTQATDHSRYPALILYDVRELSEEERRKRRMRKVQRQKLVDYEPQFDELFPRLKKEMGEKVVEFDPDNPEYVIIVPKRFYYDWQKIKTDQMIDKMRVKLPPFLDSRHPIGQFRIIGWTLVGLTAASYAALYIVIGASLAMPGAAAAGGAAGAGGAASGGATVISLAAYKAALASPAVKAAAVAASALIVIGTVKEARADEPKIDEVSAIRAVPVSDFKPRNGVQSASSSKSPFGSAFEVCQDTTGKFEIHTEVMFDGEPHYIIARVRAE